MSREIRLPRMGITMEAGVIVEWLKQPGAAIVKGEAIAQVETDKAVQELEAPASGILARILVPAGVKVPVETAIAELD